MHASVHRFLALGFSATLGLSACGSSTPDQPAGGSGGGGGQGGAGGAGGSTGAKANGLFEIHYQTGATSGDSYTEIGGFMYDGSQTDSVVWDKKKTEGDCSLYTPRTPFCEACNPGDICVDTNVCRTPPLTHDTGEITLTGLNPPSGTSPLSVYKVVPDPKVDKDISYVCSETLPMPPCAPGGPISLAATGSAAYPAFSIQAQCIAPLVVANTKIMIEGGKTFTLTWTPGTIAGARITVEFDLSHHGGSKGQIRCDTADAGSLQVSGTLLQSLIALGVTGFPSVNVSREVVSTTTVGSGQARLKVYSDLTFTAEMPGLISCFDSTECPTGQICLDPGKLCGTACTTSVDCPTGQTCQTSTKICK
jgi:hypothetical protein